MVDEIDEGIEEESIITGLKPEKLDLNGIKKVHKLLVIAESGIVDCLEMSLKEKFSGLKIYKSKDTYLEIMDESLSKSSAIQFFRFQPCNNAFLFNSFIYFINHPMILNIKINRNLIIIFNIFIKSFRHFY